MSYGSAKVSSHERALNPDLGLKILTVFAGPEIVLSVVRNDWAPAAIAFEIFLT